MKPYAEACERNQQPILDVLLTEFAAVHHVLEIGSGTGQHAVFFGRAMPHLVWQTSDLSENHAGIRAWVEGAGLVNVRLPLVLDVLGEWPEPGFDAVFSANTAHIMSWPAVTAMFAGVGQRLPPGGLLALYGPFSESGRQVSASNAAFDQWLRARDPASGIRDIEALDALARSAGLVFRRKHLMPANNRILVWQREN
ncbi:MAG TPA: DUF938 domain-containing protein [Gammaproteobacteria bacterium]|nr:DUF938 domain-containing protein [Gammaproteobacteria bacterium]